LEDKKLEQTKILNILNRTIPTDKENPTDSPVKIYNPHLKNHINHNDKDILNKLYIPNNIKEYLDDYLEDELHKLTKIKTIPKIINPKIENSKIEKETKDSFKNNPHEMKEWNNSNLNKQILNKDSNQDKDSNLLSKNDIISLTNNIVSGNNNNQLNDENNKNKDENIRKKDENIRNKDENNNKNPIFTGTENIFPSKQLPNGSLPFEVNNNQNINGTSPSNTNQQSVTLGSNESSKTKEFVDVANTQNDKERLNLVDARNQRDPVIKDITTLPSNSPANPSQNDGIEPISFDGLIERSDYRTLTKNEIIPQQTKLNRDKLEMTKEKEVGLNPLLHEAGNNPKEEENVPLVT